MRYTLCTVKCVAHFSVLHVLNVLFGISFQIQVSIYLLDNRKYSWELRTRSVEIHQTQRMDEYLNSFQYGQWAAFTVSFIIGTHEHVLWDKNYTVRNLSPSVSLNWTWWMFIILSLRCIMYLLQQMFISFLYFGMEEWEESWECELWFEWEWCALVFNMLIIVKMAELYETDAEERSRVGYKRNIQRSDWTQ